MNNSINVGNKLEEIGWLQGSIISEADLKLILEQCHCDFEITDNEVAVITSHSCDIANYKLDEGPFLDVLLGNPISKLDAQKINNQSPRVLHTILHRKTGGLDVIEDIYVEFKAFRTIKIPKEKFLNIKPDTHLVLRNQYLDNFILWLVCKYDRPTWPTSFNNRITKADPRKKLKQLIKPINEQLIGLYAKITPNKEIPPTETYSVNLLGLVSSDFEGDLEQVKKTIEQYAEIMKSAGMDVVHAVANEKDLSYAFMRPYQRFYYDDLSIRDNTSLPLDVELR
ncbi:hypothetical protein [Legionella bozemanae]|uniref:hypothetical protein n=1 Tax=Legionella bozemanae TaxID=447 RepID=UPI00399D4A5A